MAGRYALLVAAGDYDDEYFAQLRSPAQDVQSLAQVLEDPDLGGFEVQVLQNATESEIRVALDLLTAERDPDDFVLVYFSCHGLRDQSGDLFFATTPTRRALPSSTAVAASYVAGRLEQTLAGSRLLLLDCCYSGAFASGFAKGGDEPLGGEIRASRGYVCITACNEYELAYEGSELVLDEPVESAFTEKLIEGLRTGAADLDRDGWVETAELHGYVHQALGPERRQTPSYFAAGVQQKLLVARTPENPVPVVVTREVRRVRTPRFHAARFPPFRFAREDRATPTALAEAMVRHPSEAAGLFSSEDDRKLLYQWIDGDVRDRKLERSILLKPPEGPAAAEAAAAAFVAAFAPHLPPVFRGITVGMRSLIRLARSAIDGDINAGTMIEDLQRHNVLRALGLHDCRDRTHECETGGPCERLLAVAPRWDKAMLEARAVARRPPAVPGSQALAAQLLLVIVDPHDWSANLAVTGSAADLPAWWEDLAAGFRLAWEPEDDSDRGLGWLAVALLTLPAAREEVGRLHSREKETQAEAREAEEAAREAAEQLEESRRRADAERVKRRAGRRAKMLGRIRIRQRRGIILAGLVFVFPMVAMIAGFAVSAVWWRGRVAPSGSYQFDLTFARLDLSLGLILFAPLIGSLLTARQRRRRRKIGAVLTLVAAGAAIALVPIVEDHWGRHAHAQHVQRALLAGFPIDRRNEPIRSDCGYTRDATLVVAMTGWAVDPCRRADFYVDGRYQGTYQIPLTKAKNADIPWWRIGVNWDEIAATALEGPQGTWWLVGVRASDPNRPLWQSSQALDVLNPGRFRFARRGGTLLVEGRTWVYGVDLRTGEPAEVYRCPAGQRYAGMDLPDDGSVSVLCDGESVLVSP